MRKILYLQSTSEIGGTDVSLLRMVEKLDRASFQPVAVLQSQGPLVPVLEKQGCKIIFVPEMLKPTTRRGLLFYFKYLFNYPFAVWKIFRVIQAEKIDVVHTNSLHNLYGFLAAKLAKRPHIWHAREIVKQSRVFSALESFLARNFTDKLIVTSDAVAELFYNGRREFPSHLVKIPNGIDTKIFHPGVDGTSVRKDLNLSPDCPLVGIVSRLDHWKGIEVFIESAALCHQKYPDARFVVVGGAIEGREDYAEKMAGLAKERNLENLLYFTGWKYGPADMPHVYAAFDVFVLASTWPEPFGWVVVEAMAAGVPVIATNQGGPKEICVDGTTGILVPPRDAAAMSEAILSLLRDPDRARQMGEAGRKRAVEHFNRDDCMNRLQTVYREVMKSF